MSLSLHVPVETRETTKGHSQIRLVAKLIFLWSTSQMHVPITMAAISLAV